MTARTTHTARTPRQSHRLDVLGAGALGATKGDTMTRRYTPTRTVAAQHDQVARIQRRITADGSVIVPPRMAAWLERNAGVTGDRRIRLRGEDPVAYEVLAALHLAALRHRSGCGTKVAAHQPHMTGSKMWLTTSEAAHEADVTDRCIRKWIAQSELPATRHGGRWLIHRTALQAKIITD